MRSVGAAAAAFTCKAAACLRLWPRVAHGTFPQPTVRMRGPSRNEMVAQMWRWTRAHARARHRPGPTQPGRLPRPRAQSDRAKSEGHTMHIIRDVIMQRIS